MFFTCLQWTDVHIPFCFPRNWLQLSLKIKVNTWCLSGENIYCVGCLWKAVSKFNLVCCWFGWVFLIKLTFSWTKFAFSALKLFMYLHSTFTAKAFSGSEENSSDPIQEKRPVHNRWNRFKSLFCLTWFSSLPDECLDHTTEKRMGQCLFLFLFWKRKTKLFLLFPSYL